MIDMAGVRLNPKLFIKVFRDVVKLAPARFLTLRIHPDRYKELYALADVPETILLGSVPGMLGRMVLKVNCIKPPSSVGDGITIIQDRETPPDQLVFLIHGIPDMIIQNLAVNESPA